MTKKSKGFTLLEVVFTLILVTSLTSVMVFLYVTVLKSWDMYGERSDMREKIQFALEQMTRDVRNASAVNVSGNAVRFSVASSHYIYYLANTSELRKAALVGGINGSLSGAGDLIVSGLSNTTTMTNTGVCDGTSSSSCVVKINLI